MEKNVKIPKLRFPEFSDKWEKKKMGEVGEFKNGINKSSEDFGFGVPFINLMDVFGKQIISDLNLGLVNANDKEIEQYNLLEGDVLFIRSSVKKSGVGETSVVLKNMPRTVYSGFLIRFRDTFFKVNLNFKKYCFYTTKFRNDLVSLSSTSANTNINQESLNSLILSLPSLPEQQKIASFLTAVDDKLQAIKKKKSLLEQYKKGVMQKIFSQELRFKADDGSEFPEWEVKTLGEIGDVKMCRRIFNDETLPIGEIPFYKIGSFGKDADAFISHELYLEYRTKFSFPTKGDILISAAGTIGRLVVYNGEDAYFQDSNIVWIDNDKSIVSNEFLFYILQFVKYNTEGGTIQRLYNNILKSTRFICPSLHEQTKIANFLSATDEKIQLVYGQIEKMEIWKKGLLQKMFV